MKNKFVFFQNLYYRHESTAEWLLRNLSAGFPIGWTAVVGAKGAGKITILKLGAGLLEPRKGQVRLSGNAVYCA